MKSLVFFMIALLISNSILVTGLSDEEHTRTSTLSLSFHEPSFIENGSSVSVQMKGAPACTYEPGSPVLPMYTTTLQLPFGSIITDVAIDFQEVHTQSLQGKITQAPSPFVQGDAQAPSIHTTSASDETAAVYPAQWITYSTGGGLNENGDHVTFLTVRVFPARYNQSTGTISYLDSCDVNITYEPPASSPFPSQTKNDLVILCPLQFVLPLLPLVIHKNMVGIRTKLVTLPEVYRSYPGFDKPEQIKLFIKDVVETWGTTYVLLVGGLRSHLTGRPRDDRSSGIRDWYLPVRYSNLCDDDTIYDPGFISDLYYADIYDSQGKFCNWDSFGDGVYGGWSYTKGDPQSYPLDQIDFFPDVYLGRLPCRNTAEVRSIVKKIITYERTAADSSWFNTIVVAAGDPYDDKGTNYPEGELIGDKAVSCMTEFETRKLYASNKETDLLNTPLSKNIIREINEGCGFLFLDGHGGPSWWNTYWLGEFDALIEHGGLRCAQFPLLKNGWKLPVCIVGGCHINMFNVSVSSTITDRLNKRSMWSNGLPISECWGWSITEKSNGGAIATIGNTGLGLEAGGEVGDLNGDGINEPDCVEALCGYLETQFFEGYQANHIDILGQTWCHAITEYLRVYPGMEGWSDAKTIEQWVLLGDPSLKIGG